MNLLFFARGIDEPARLASRDQASPGSRLSPFREFIGELHLEGAGGARCERVASLLVRRVAPGCRHPRKMRRRVGRDSVSLLPFAVGIGEAARLASRDQASPGSRLSPFREFIGERHLEGAGGPV